MTSQATGAWYRSPPHPLFDLRLAASLVLRHPHPVPEQLLLGPQLSLEPAFLHLPPVSFQAKFGVTVFQPLSFLADLPLLG